MVTMQVGSQFHNITNKVKKKIGGACVLLEIFMTQFRNNFKINLLAYKKQIGKTKLRKLWGMIQYT